MAKKKENPLRGSFHSDTPSDTPPWEDQTPDEPPKATPAPKATGSTPDKTGEGKEAIEPPKAAPAPKATGSTPDKTNGGKETTEPPKAAPDPKATGSTPGKTDGGKETTEPPKVAPDPKATGSTPSKTDGGKETTEPPKVAPDPKATGSTPGKTDGGKEATEPLKAAPGLKATSPTLDQTDGGKETTEPPTVDFELLDRLAPNAHNVALSDITTLPGTYVKDVPRDNYIDLFYHMCKSGMDPIILRKGEKGELQLVDGFHRCKALEQNNQLKVQAYIYDMPLKEAIRYRKEHREKPDLPIPGKLVPPHPPEPEKPAEPSKGAEPSDVPVGQEEEIPKNFTLPIIKEGQSEIITTLKVDDIHPFEDHPFNVKDDKDMWDLVDSVKKFGVLEPVVVIPREKGGYEMVSGHRRQRACQLAGITTIPVIVRQLDRDEATISMVDANLKRENITPMEKAKAYKMKLEAMQRKAGRRSKAEILSGEKPKRADEILAQQTGESRSNIQKIVRLNNLTPELQQMVEEKTLPVHTAADLSYLKQEEQAAMAEAIQKEGKVPSGTQAVELKKASQEGTLTAEKIEKAVAPTKREENPPLKITLGEEDLRPYFPEKGTTIPDVKRGIFEALDMRKKAYERQKAAKAQAQKEGKEKKSPSPVR